MEVQPMLLRLLIKMIPYIQRWKSGWYFRKYGKWNNWSLVKNNIIKNNKQRPVIPSDIGILVRSKAHGKLIKEKLSRYNIPAIVVDDAKVLETNEAKDLYYLLYAILDPNNSSISRALLSSFTGFNPDHIRILTLNCWKKDLKIFRIPGI